MSTPAAPGAAARDGAGAGAAGHARLAPREELSDFLRARRAAVTPADLGLPAGTRRRVPGLRREEVALVAGISVEYYTRLERGAVGEVSAPVLDAVARALLLDDVQREHLDALAHALASPAPRRRAPARTRVRPTVQQVLDELPTPAYVRNGRLDLLAANHLGRALYSPVYDSPARTRGGIANSALFCFLDPAAPDFFADWERNSEDCVAILRAEAGRDPYDVGLQELVGTLCTRSDRFRLLWARHDVRRHRNGTKRFVHPVVGPLELAFEGMDLPGDDGQRLNVYLAAPDSPARDALALLRSWAAPAPADTP